MSDEISYSIRIVELKCDLFTTKDENKLNLKDDLPPLIYMYGCFACTACMSVHLTLAVPAEARRRWCNPWSWRDRRL